MEKLLEFRELMKKIYRRYGVAMEIALKGIFAFLSLAVINRYIGAMPILQGSTVRLVMAVVCAVVPVNLMLLILALTAVAHVYAISMEMAVLLGIILLIMFLFYFRFASGDGFLLLLVSILFSWKLPLILAVPAGLLASPFSMVAAGFGAVFYFFMTAIQAHRGDLELSGALMDNIQKAGGIAKEVLEDQGMYLYVITFALTITAVYIIRRLSFSYSWYVAIVTGTILQIVVMVMGNKSLEASMYTTGRIVGTSLLGLVIAVVIAFAKHHMDYKRTERVQFEDDDYYYYVKAVPKVRLPEKKKRKRIKPKKEEYTQDDLLDEDLADVEMIDE